MTTNHRELVRDMAILAVFAAIALAVMLVAGHTEASTYEESYMPGRPLDAVKMSAPTFSDKDYCYKVADRTSGACWWLLHVDGQWVELPVCDGASYVRQQQEQATSKAGE